MAMLAYLFPSTIAEWFFAWLWFDLPWYLSPIPALIAGIGGLLGRILYLLATPLPALDPHPRLATVTRRTTVVYDQEDNQERTYVHVWVDTPDGGFDSVLADHVADEEQERFILGSQWSVRTFADHSSRVFLSDAHDDVLRLGYHLDGVRMAGEHHQWPQAKPRSPLLRKRFRE